MFFGHRQMLSLPLKGCTDYMHTPNAVNAFKTPLTPKTCLIAMSFEKNVKCEVRGKTNALDWAQQQL